MLLPEKLLALGQINPELEEIFKNNPPPQGFDASANIAELRATLSAVKKKLTSTNTASLPSYVEVDRQIPVRDGSTIDIRIHSPKDAPRDGCPIFVVYHGGGFCLGGLDNEAVLCRKFTELGGVAINVDYRLAPEHPFPTPVNDAYDALKWTAENFTVLGGNPAKGFLVGGISAGANLAAVVSHLYVDDKLSPRLSGAYLSIPSTFAPEALPSKYKAVYLSREQNSKAPILNDDSLQLFESLYKADPTSSLRSPVVFESHNGLPSTYFQICGMDPLRDEAFIYEEMLREDSGINTKVDVYPGLPHGFWSWFPDAQFSKKFQKDCVNGMSWLLDQSS